MTATREQMLGALRAHLQARLDAQHGSTTSESAINASIDFMCGAAATIDALGLDQSHDLTALAFLVSVRGPDEFLKPKVTT